MATDWTNNDGLRVKFGTNEATPSVAGSYKRYGEIHGSLELNLDLTLLADTNAVMNYQVGLPDNAQIVSVEVLVTEAVTGTNAVLDLGLIDSDYSSNHDDDALLVALAQTALADIGDRAIFYQDTSGHGVEVGTILTKKRLITAGYDTAAFTAGELKITISYLIDA